jgi:hypothetical protein
MADPLKKERDVTVNALNKLIKSNKAIIDNTDNTEEAIKEATLQNKKANAERKTLEKQELTLRKDLTKNFKDIGTTITGGLEGMMGETFGPLGGIAASLTTGFFKRSQSRKEDLNSNKIQIDSSKQLVKEMEAGKTATEKVVEEIEEGTEAAEDAGGESEALSSMTPLLEEQKKTTKAIKGSRETAEEEEKESDKQHKELIDALKGLKVESVKDVGDDGGFFAGLGGIASILGGIAIGLSTPGIFNISQLTKSLDNFKTKFPKVSSNIKKFFGFADDIPKIPDTPKIPDVSTKLTGWKAGFREFFNIPAKEIDTATDALKVAGAADEAGATSKVIARAQKFMGIELPGFMQKSITKIDDVVKGADVAVDASKMGGLASKVGSIAKFLTVGVAGRALSIAGNPVFDVIAMGKDVFDIASAVTDDDVKSAVKNEDIGALVGGFIGGAIGIIGGPAGVALGMGLGNMAGEFIGKAMDDPEILGAIDKVEANLKAERKGLADEIAAIEAEMKSATDPVEQARLQAQKDKLTARQTEVTTELEQFTNKESELNKQRDALKAIEDQANKINAEKAALELKIAEAEERGDSAMVARLTNRVTILDEEFDKADDAYQVQAEKLRKTASATSGALADQTNSFFDKMVTEGGFFGSILGSVSQVATLWGGEGLGMKGEGGKKYLAEAMKKIEGQIAEQQALIDAGDDFDWALEPRAAIIAKLTREKTRLSSVEVEGAARGAIIVNRPTYLPNSGIVVGEHASYSGRGAAKGGFPNDGGPEAIVPLGSDRAGAFFDPIAQRMGENLNAQMYARIGQERGRGSMYDQVPNVVDASTNTNVTNNTIIRTPSPSGPNLHFEGRDFVHKVA